MKSPSFSMCQYAVLTSLAQEPRSGYDIAQWFAVVTRHFWVVGHSSIYPALADLERRGLVEYVETPSDQGPIRKVYHLTDAGREALMDWVAQPAADAEVRDEQLLKAASYGFLASERAIELLRGVRARHAERQARFEEMARDAEAAGQGGEPHQAAVALGEKLTARRGALAQQSYVAWCDEAIATIEALAARGRLPGAGPLDD